MTKRYGFLVPTAVVVVFLCWPWLSSYPGGDALRDPNAPGHPAVHAPMPWDDGRCDGIATRYGFGEELTCVHLNLDHGHGH